MTSEIKRQVGFSLIQLVIAVAGALLGSYIFLDARFDDLMTRMLTETAAISTRVSVIESNRYTANDARVSEARQTTEIRDLWKEIGELKTRLSVLEAHKE